jgi:hypothetical protein
VILDTYSAEGHRVVTVTEDPQPELAGTGAGRVLTFVWDGTGTITMSVMDLNAGGTIGLRISRDDLTAVAAAAREEHLIEKAAELGADAGRDAAGWAFDGNTTLVTYQTVLAQIEAGDAQGGVMEDQLPDDGEGDVLADLDISMDDESAPVSDIMVAWEEAAKAAFWAAIEKTCREQITAAQGTEEQANA